MKSYLMWVQGIKGPEAQIWFMLPNSEHSYLAKYELSDEEVSLHSIDQLAQKYPYPPLDEPPRLPPYAAALEIHKEKAA